MHSQVIIDRQQLRFDQQKAERNVDDTSKMSKLIQIAKHAEEPTDMSIETENDCSRSRLATKLNTEDDHLIKEEPQESYTQGKR